MCGSVTYKRVNPNYNNVQNNIFKTIIVYIKFFTCFLKHIDISEGLYIYKKINVYICEIIGNIKYMYKIFNYYR